MNLKTKKGTFLNELGRKTLPLTNKLTIGRLCRVRRLDSYK